MLSSLCSMIKLAGMIPTHIKVEQLLQVSIKVKSCKPSNNHNVSYASFSKITVVLLLGWYCIVYLCKTSDFSVFSLWLHLTVLAMLGKKICTLCWRLCNGKSIRCEVNWSHFPHEKQICESCQFLATTILIFSLLSHLVFVLLKCFEKEESFSVNPSNSSHESFRI